MYSIVIQNDVLQIDVLSSYANLWISTLLL